MEYYKKLKDASVKVVKQGTEIIKTVSAKNAFDEKIMVNNQGVEVYESSGSPIALFIEKFNQLCHNLTELKHACDEDDYLCEEDAKYVRTTLKAIIVCLESENNIHLISADRNVIDLKQVA